ncbi:MAG: nuclear transport factor 2 family protein [Acidobacteriota bacterium]|nr:nuclear transport factor 2 family protein [Acidobacteriota bacterium]
MNIRKTALPALLALLWVGCKTSGGFDPIEIDVSRKTSPPPPTATATPVPAPAGAPAATPRIASPTPTPAPTPTATPAPAPTPGSTSGILPARAAGTPAAVSLESVAPSQPPGGFAGETANLATRKRIDAYNRRDIDLLMGLYAPDAQIYDPPDRLRDSGTAQIRQTYARRFSAAPDSRLEDRDVAVQGPYVVSRETEKSGGREGFTVLVISEVRDGKIVRVWILR